MELKISKNSFFKSVILTLVSLVCFVGVSVGQIEVRARNNNKTTGEFSSCGGKYKFLIQANDQYNELQFEIWKDGTKCTKSDISSTTINTHVSWSQPDNWYFSPSSTNVEGWWLVYDPSANTLTYQSDEPNCGNSVASATASVSSTGLLSACLSDSPQLTSTYTVGSGSFTPLYQWYKDGSEISGETNSTYTPNSIGSYTVKVYAGDYGDANPATSNAVAITGPVVTTATLSSNNSVFCPGNTTLSVAQDASCTPSGYPKYKWYKGGVEISGATNATYSPTEAGTYKVIVYADASTSKESNTITLSAPSPSITFSPSELSLQALMSGGASSGSVTVSLNNSCSTLKTPVITGANAAMYSVTDNNNGTYTITFTPGSTKGAYPATLTFSSNDNAVSESINLRGKVVACLSSDLGTFDFSTNSVGSTVAGITLTTSLTNTMTDQNAPRNGAGSAYKVGSSNWFKYVKATSGVSGNYLQIAYSQNQSFTDNKVHIFTLTGNVDNTKAYQISFLAGENAEWDSPNSIAYYIGNNATPFASISKQSSSTISAIVSAADLASGTEIYAKFDNGTSYKMSYYDNIVISSVCPPEVEYSSVTNECDVNPSFTAEVTKGSADVVKYEWYVLEEGQSIASVSPTVTHNSSSLTDIFSQSAEIGAGKTVKVVVTDANGLSADVEYEINCGPVIESITVPSEICPGGNLILTVPSVSPTEGITSQGWEIAESATATSSEWSVLPSLANIPVEKKNWYIRYFAQNSVGRGKSNAVQITMFDAPIVNPISVDDICAKNTFTLDNPDVEYDATKDYEKWQYSTQSNFSSVTDFTSSTQFNTAGTYYIRYVAKDACTTTYATTTAKVNDPSLSVTEYPTFMRVAGTQQVVATAPTLEKTCIENLTYSLVDALGNDIEASEPEFEIDENTGVITMTEYADVAGNYQIYVKISSEELDPIIYPLTISLTEEPILQLDCSATTDYYVYTKYQKLNLQNVVTSNFVNDDVTLTLSGSASSYFNLTPSSVTKNTSNVPVTIAQNDFFTGVGDYTLKLTATTEGLTEECNVNIHVKNLNITDYINDQTNCSSDAPSLMVGVTGEDATNLPLTFQWYKDDVAISGATSNTFKPMVDGNYYCTVSTGSTLLHTSKTSNVFFVKDMPVLTFDESSAAIPSEVFCSQEVGAVLKVTLSGVDVTGEYSRFWWQNGGKSDGLTATGVHTYTFDCADNNYTTTIGAYIVENATGCAIPVTKEVTIKAMNKIYSYYGPTGDASDVTNRQNWFSCKNSSGEIILDVHPIDASEHVIPMQEGTFYNQIGDPNNHKKEQVTCSMPPASNAFSENGAQYIINKDDVKLKSDQTWTVIGEGSKVVVGNGYWENGSLPSAGNSWSTTSNTYNLKNNQYAEIIGSGMRGDNQVDKYSTLASYDYRNYAKEFTIEGTLNTGAGVPVDVTNGGSLKIATTSGNFELGTLATDKLYNLEGDANGFYNVVVLPGSSVTYVGAGTEKIREGEYSQLYIEPTNSTDNVVFENKADIVIHQSLSLGENATFTNINPNESVITYDGKVNQTIASMPYYELNLQTATDKTLAGNIDVASSFVIGTGVVCKAGNNIVNINGSGDDAFVFDGKQFDCGTSTVAFNSSENTRVPALTYYNLDLGDGNRKLSEKNIIAIAGTFEASETATYEVTGSTVEFNGNGSVTQHIPQFTFYNLTINSTALSNNTDNSFNDAYNVVMDGDVNIGNQIVFTKGVLNTNNNKLTIENQAADAVGQGYYTSTKDASFVLGDMTRILPKASSDGGSYYFPIGDQNGYKPFMISQSTTTDVSEVTVSLAGGMSGSFTDASGESTVSTSYSWKLTTDDKYVDGRVAVSTSSGLNDANAVVYGQETSGTFENIFGSAVGNSIMYTQKKGEGYYALTKRNATSKTYYYNCSGSVDASQVGAWFTEENGSGTAATNFDEPDAEWIIKCGTTITGGLSIMGANSKVTLDIPSEQSLKLKSSVDFITAVHKQGTIEIDKKGELKVDYGFVMRDDASAANKTTIKNNGKLDVRNTEITLKNSIIENNGFLYSENVNWTLTSDQNQAPETIAENPQNFKHTMFINNGTIQMVNANFDVPRGAGGDGNLVHIRNAASGVWLIDNSTSSGAKHVNFNGANFEHADVGKGVSYIDFQCGSSFVVKKTDVKMIYGSAAMVQRIGGEIVVEDGNLYITRYDQTGGNFTLEQSCGAIYLNDTDKSGDGILQLQGGGGGYEVNIEGTMYVMGMVEKGGSGAKFNVKDGAKVFIGNIGALMPAYSWQFKIDIEEGGSLYYCGNRSAGPDNVGTNEGSLYYAGSYYNHSDPISESDFNNTTPGTYELMFVGEEDCMSEYKEGLPNTEKGHLLPIELTLLYAVCNENNEVELRWQTASETHNDYFTILRSFDGIHFEELDIVWGAGTTTEFHNYEYIDKDDNDGIVYYKLRQTDYNGEYTESKIIAVQTCGPNAQFRIAEDQIDIFFKHPEASNYVVITSITGQIFYSKSFKSVDAARIAAPQRKGIYIISVIDSQTITSEKFVR